MLCFLIFGVLLSLLVECSVTSPVLPFSDPPTADWLLLPTFTLEEEYIRCCKEYFGLSESNLKTVKVIPKNSSLIFFYRHERFWESTAQYKGIIHLFATKSWNDTKILYSRIIFNKRHMFNLKAVYIVLEKLLWQFSCWKQILRIRRVREGKYWLWWPAIVFILRKKEYTESIECKANRIYVRIFYRCCGGVGLYTVPKVIDFPQYNMKCSGENVILRGIVHVVSGSPLHFMFYRRNLDCFSNRVGLPRSSVLFLFMKP